MQQPVLKLIQAISTFALLWQLSACSSSSRQGIVLDSQGNAVAATVVRLITIDDAGEQLSLLAAGQTDSQGHFSFSFAADTNASVVVIADLPSGSQRGFYAGSDNAIPVTPLTEAFVTLVADITSTSGGVTLADFSHAELQTIANAIFANDILTLDMSDPSALQDYLRTQHGRAIAQAAGGQASAITTAQLQGNATLTTANFAPDIGICGLGAAIFVLSSSDFRFDLEEDGSLCGGSHASFNPILAEPSMQLILPQETFDTYGGHAFPSAAGGSAPLTNDREVALGGYAVIIPGEDPPVADQLLVSRKVYAPSSGDWLRYLDVFTNTSGTARTISRVEVSSALATGNDSLLLTYDQNESQNSPSSSDRYLAAYDAFQNAPTALFIYQDGLTANHVAELFAPGLVGGAVNEITYAWENLVVPGNQSLALIHYLHLNTSRTAAAIQNIAENFLSDPDMTGLSLTELQSLVNFVPNRGTVIGSAGTVIGLAIVTATNQRTALSQSVRAHRDGSFAVPLDTASQDQITLTASDGLNTTLIVP